MSDIVKSYRPAGKDFFTCWKALMHSERIFKDAIVRKDFPKDSTEEEFLGYLADIVETREKIEEIFRSEPKAEVH